MMIGQTIEARPPFPAGAVAWAATGFVLLGIAIAAGEPHYALASTWPWTMAAVLWFRQASPVAFLIEEDGLHPLDGKPEILYASLQAVVVPDAPSRPPRAVGKPQPMVVFYDAGYLLLPPILNVPPVELFHFLQSKIPQRTSKSVHPTLEGFFNEHVGKFGESKVHVTSARPSPRRVPARSTSATVGIGFFWGGVLTIVATIVVLAAGHQDQGYEAWIVFGTLSALVGGLCWLAARSYVGQPNKALARNPDACIIVSPAGLAMVQGDIQGMLRWGEITGTRVGGARFLDMPKQKGLEI